MVEPKRWLQDEDAPRELVQLLRVTPRPRAASPARRMAMVGILAGAAAQTPRVAWGLAWLKTALYSGAVVVAGAGALTVARHQQTHELPRTDSETVVMTAPASPPSRPADAVVVAAEAPAAPSPVRHATRPHAAVHVKEPTDTLAEEEALLEGARRELAQSPSDSLKLLRQHQQRFPNGELTAERLFLGTDAAVRLGDGRTAHQMADALTARFPSSAYVRRLPVLLGSLR